MRGLLVTISSIPPWRVISVGAPSLGCQTKAVAGRIIELKLYPSLVMSCVFIRNFNLRTR